MILYHGTNKAFDTSERVADHLINVAKTIRDLQ